MKARIYSVLSGLVFLVAVVAAPHRLQATLGESPDSVRSDREALSATGVVTKAHHRYTVEQVESDSTTVREYVSPSGVIFAVAWNGLVHQDLRQLLGSYADEYEQALKHTPRQWDRRRLRVKANRVIVETWGHMRNLQGRAYIPALIPSGVSIHEVK